ncbi:MAG: DUF4338 domain-containing protein [Thermocrinis sp.]|nr:DUF4338 domain-containing protein [Thermocrinis sp.]
MILTEIERVLQLMRENPREYMRYVAREVNPGLSPQHYRFFAKKTEIRPEKVQLELELVEGDKLSSLFRSAMSFWSVPISAGYGRRLRFIVWDRTHYKVFGIFGLCDPLIGLRVRDTFIGWSKEQKEERLYNMMTAYVLGAVPPYNELFGAKMVALAVGCKEVCQAFEEKYKGKKTILKGREPLAKLVAVDTMAFFGKSLIYEGLPEWRFLGFTKGTTHIHLSHVWDSLLRIAKELGLNSVDKYSFGQGSNWKFRVLRELFSRLGLSERYFNVGLAKGYYFRPLIKEWKEFLNGQTDQLTYVNKTFEEYVELWRAKYLKRGIRRFSRAS